MLKTENGRQEPTSSFFTSLLSLYLQVSPNSTKIQCKRCLQKGKKMYTIFAYIYCILLPLSHYYVCSNLEKDALHSPYVSLLQIVYHNRHFTSKLLLSFDHICSISLTQSKVINTHIYCERYCIKNRCTEIYLINIYILLIVLTAK